MDRRRTVSVVIPTRNEADHLGDCLKSIHALDYPEDLVEVIVVDNGSSDNTRDIAAEFENVTLLRDDHLRVSGLRNLGSRQAKGEFLAFVDADCVVSRDWLWRASEYFDTADVVAWGAPPVPPPDSTWVQRAWFLVRSKENTVQKVDWLESMNLFVRREHFLRIGGFNEKLVTCEDVDLCYRLGQHGTIVSDSRIAGDPFWRSQDCAGIYQKGVLAGTGEFGGASQPWVDQSRVAESCYSALFWSDYSNLSCPGNSLS